jgi:hypothetical protein
MNELVIYPSKFKMVLLTAGALIFVCVGLAFAIWRDEAGLTFWEFAFMAWVVIPFFGFCFLYACYRLIVPKPALIINHRGIFDNASALSAGLVEWDEIDKVFIYEYQGQRILGIIPLDVKAFLERQPVFKRWLMKVNTRLVEAPINIPQSTLPVKVDELVLKILEVHQNYVGLREEHEDS